ncbi:MAG: biotin--[Treponema sp.]|nr:biotin--[acetyl-CoA-carboxylase] ligase [Treponema sp.]
MSFENVISLEKVKSLLKTPCEITVFDSLDSTNAEAKRRCNNAIDSIDGASVAIDANGVRENGAIDASGSRASDARKLNRSLIVAETQTAGRGRLGRSFFSSTGTGLYFSMIFSNHKMRSPSLYTALAAVAVCRSLESVYGVEPMIKWVNDIFLNGKKVSGILSEGIVNASGVIEYVVVGIGVNILPSDVPLNLKDVVGFVLDEKNADSKKNELLSIIVNNLIELYEADDSECCDCTNSDSENARYKSAMKEYRARSFLIGKRVCVSPVACGGDDLCANEKYFAKVLDVTEDAKLVVKLDDGSVKELESGEVSVGSGSVL